MQEQEPSFCEDLVLPSPPWGTAAVFAPVEDLTEVGSLSLAQFLARAPDRTWCPTTIAGRQPNSGAVREDPAEQCSDRPGWQRFEPERQEAAPDCSACQHGAQIFSFARRLTMFCHGKE
jgi:hypothetical protein